MDDLIADFITEANESLDVVDVELVNFEACPTNRAALDRIFRLVHTLKGTCGFLGLPRLEAVAHAGETLLGRFRDGKLAVTQQAVTLVLQSIDRIKLIVAGLASAGVEPAGDDSALIAALEDLSEGRGAPEAAPSGAVAEPDRALRPGEVSLAELDAAFDAAPGPAAATDLAPVAADVAAEPRSPVAQAEDGPREDVAVAAQSIRVGLEALEGMMTLVSELVLTRNQLLQINRSRGDDAFATPLQRLSAITGELQDSVMKTRMQPIGQAWKKLPRLVRDLAFDLGKKIDLSLEGEATELDRQVLEQIRDPLTHMVRNSADHGLERPDDRAAAGKPETGTIRLSAFHEGGSIVIRLRDDGRGLDTARIREKAVEKGLIGRSESESMSEAQIHRLIFAPGFSTAAAVTSVSGRGVGMDVVRSNIEQIGGQIDIYSVAGAGCTMTIKIPLTLAIVSSLIVGAGGDRFAVPQACVLELVRTGHGSGHRFETIEQVRMLRLRETFVPIIDLGAELKQAGPRAAEFVIVVQVGQHRFGVLVDEVIDTEEIVVKPLASVLRHIDVFSGATILGDGSVVLIVDPNGLAKRAGEIPAGIGAGTGEDGWDVDTKSNHRSMLIVRAGGGAPKAVELRHVTRLERVRADQIERVGAQAAIQYRGKLTPVLTLGAGYTLRESGVQPLLVLAGSLYAMALAVDQIVDVVEDQLNIELSPEESGFLGTAVIAGRATEIIDVDHFALLALAARAGLDRASQGAAGQSETGRHAA